MKIDFNVPLLDVKGQPVPGTTIAEQALVVLQNTAQNDDPAEKLKRFDLAQKIAMVSEGPVELSVEECVLLKKYTGLRAHVIVHARIEQLIEGDDKVRG